MNNLPKKGWAVKNDGSKEFEELVLKPLNQELQDHGNRYSLLNEKEVYCGKIENGAICYSYKASDFDTILTISQFIELSKEIAIPKKIKELDDRVSNVADKIGGVLNSASESLNISREHYVELVQLIHDLEKALISVYTTK
ncbi:MAG TPA: hypothetical protein VGE24_14535 [Emticicia sp.]